MRPKALRLTFSQITWTTFKHSVMDLLFWCSSFHERYIVIITEGKVCTQLPTIFFLQVCRRDPAQKSRFVRCLFQLLRSESPAVSYEAAWSLVSLSTAPTAVRACAQTYASLLNSSSDNNVKLIVLDRLSELKKHHSKVVQEIIMDILRALSSPNIHICKKTLAVAIDLVGPRNIEEVQIAVY